MRIKRASGRAVGLGFLDVVYGAYRLELTVKDAVKDTLFDLIDEILLHLYYLYVKSLQKMQRA